jgi:hypothetical protein
MSDNSPERRGFFGDPEGQRIPGSFSELPDTSKELGAEGGDINDDQAELPPGPLTFEDYRRLSASFYDGGAREKDQAQAAARGIQPGEYIRFRIDQDKPPEDGTPR